VRPDRHCGLHNLIITGYRVLLPSVKPPGREVHSHLNLNPKLRLSGVITPLPLCLSAVTLNDTHRHFYLHTYKCLPMKIYALENLITFKYQWTSGQLDITSEVDCQCCLSPELFYISKSTKQSFLSRLLVSLCNF
jgi:hypothetical protein